MEPYGLHGQIILAAEVAEKRGTATICSNSARSKAAVMLVKSSC